MTVYDYISQNNRRTLVVFLVFFLLIGACIWGISYGFAVAHYSHPPDDSADYVDYSVKTVTGKIGDSIANALFPPPKTQEVNEEEVEWIAPDVYPTARAFAWRTTLLFVLLLMLLLSAPPSFIENMPLSSAHASWMKSEQYRELYRLAGTVFMTAGLPTPKIYVIADDSLNAFTVGLSAKRACLVLTQGALDKLNRQELEAVIAHEAAHVACRDTRLMLVAVWSVFLFSFLAEVFTVVLYYGAKRNFVAIILLWILSAVCALIGFVFAPLGRLTVSRSCELRADALAVWLCRNPQALESALKKIAQNPYVSILENHPTMVGMCICNPSKKQTLFGLITGLGDSHPPLSVRLDNLRDMDGNR